LNIIDGKMSVEEIVTWLEQFQARVNELTKSNCLQFTLNIWDPDYLTGEILSNKKAKFNLNAALPCPDMEFYWHQTNLTFHVHLKTN